MNPNPIIAIAITAVEVATDPVSTAAIQCTASGSGLVLEGANIIDF